MNPIGNTWLRAHFSLPNTPAAHESYLGARLLTFYEKDGTVRDTYTKQYEPKAADDPLAHLEFGLKYDGIDLHLLSQVFAKLSPEVVGRFVQDSPTGRYARQMGFLYEFLTGGSLSVSGIGGNYVPILDPERYITAPEIKVTRWRVDNNLLGDREFSPVVRLTENIKSAIARDWRGDIDKVLAGTPPALLYRALSYLYAKETRSSYLIEREEPGRDREERFIAALRKSGTVRVEDSIALDRLIALQNTIVDPRYAEKAFRHLQNYVGENLPGMKQLVHYVPPPWEMVDSLMDGLRQSLVRMESVSPVAQAAVAGFQFVFIHPFEDGNGRLHRLLFQDVLARRGVVSTGAALPISASILAEMHLYSEVLEDFSRRIMAVATFSLDDQGVLTLQNGPALEFFWRYPDLTRQTEFLASVMSRAIEQLPKELAFLRNYDVAKADLLAIVDLPSQRLGSLMKWLDAGGGHLSNNKRKQFAELTDDEISRIEAAYSEAFRET